MIDFGTTQRRQDQCGVSAHQVRPVQLRRDVHGEGGVAHRGGRDVGIRGSLYEVAPHADEDLGLTIAQRPDRIDGVVAVLPGRVKAELGLQSVEEMAGGTFPNAHGPITLDVRVAADRE